MGFLIHIKILSISNKTKEEIDKYGYIDYVYDGEVIYITIYNGYESRYL